MRNLHSNIITNASDILLDIDGVILDQSFDNLFWQELIPLKLSISKNISLEEAKLEIKTTASKIYGTLPWYELEFWENRYDIDFLSAAAEHSSKINFLPNAEQVLNQLSSLDKRIILLTNCDPRLLNIKAGSVPFMQYVDGCISSVELGVVKEHQGFWSKAFRYFNINPKFSLFADDNLYVVNAAIKAGIENSFQVLEPTSNVNIINEPEAILTIRNIGDLI
jgi:HAD superfamily hydrolase (TIGR01509 family)